MESTDPRREDISWGEDGGSGDPGDGDPGDIGSPAELANWLAMDFRLFWLSTENRLMEAMPKIEAPEPRLSFTPSGRGEVLCAGEPLRLRGEPSSTPALEPRRDPASDPLLFRSPGTGDESLPFLPVRHAHLGDPGDPSGPSPEDPRRLFS